jgi:hypothetical protein
MKFRYFRCFNGFRIITVSGIYFLFLVSEIVFTVSEILSGFRKMFTVSVIYVTYTGVGSLRGDPRQLGGDPLPPDASCHVVRAAGGLKRAEGAKKGGYPVRESKKGGPPPDLD